jgi:hypothetical protein
MRVFDSVWGGHISMYLTDALNVFTFGELFQRLYYPSPLVRNSCVRPCVSTVTSREIPSIFLLVKVDISILIGMIPVALSQDLVNTILVAFKLCKCCHCMYVILLLL